MYCYFDNDAKVRAPFDALALEEKVRERLGLTAWQPTRNEDSPETTPSPERKRSPTSGRKRPVADATSSARKPGGKKKPERKAPMRNLGNL